MLTPATLRTRPADRNADEGSLLMALLFTMMISALSIAIMVSVMTGLKKAENSRSFALAQQAADIALADALMHANLRLLTTSPATNSGITGSGPATVNWSWTATQTTPGAWTVDVEARGKNVDRHFRSTLARTAVIQGTWSDSDNDPMGIRDNIRYTANSNRYFGTGFYARSGMEFNPSGVQAAVVDGYNGGRGMVATSGTADLHNAEVDLVSMWNWKPTDTLASRCMSSLGACEEKVRRYEQNFQTDPTDNCGGDDWVASSGIPLQHEDCYQSLTFDVDYYFQATAGQQAWITAQEDITINPGVNVGVNRTRVYTKPTSWALATRIGAFNLGSGAMFSGGIYNPTGGCVVSGNDTQPTTWIGAAACNRIDVEGYARLRYDGAMANVERPSDATSSAAVWNLRDFQIID